MRRARDEYEDTQSDIECARPEYRWAIYVFLIYLAGTICLGIYWSSAPAELNVRATTQHQLATLKIPVQTQWPKGVATTSTLISISETLLDKHGGYLTNDFSPPGIWLDNMSHWELGVITQVRDTTQILRSSLSQSNLKHDLDVDLQKAEVRFNFSDNSWGVPSTESQYRSGIEHLQKYNLRLLQAGAENAQFHVDAQHLNDYLAGVEQRLKILSQRLTASVGPNPNTDASAISMRQANAKKIVSALYTKTPWTQVDDIFYEARGSSWALIAVLQAVEIDFVDVLQNKRAQVSYEQIIRELKPTQDPVYSPMILNGDGFGFVANHSLTMASYLARAQAAISDCRRQLLVSTP
ncbi:DUF2333 family protein [Cellvibrio zantedeschiae]|uniref:DUF2333 family protein n=1 Tax=Cellvibrio zantedeschiae TaxID=1237077 RepID=UPI001677F4EB|nr:DUF2333 family protein [Cellvibrio zantedeschiae]